MKKCEQEGVEITADIYRKLVTSYTVLGEHQNAVKVIRQMKSVGLVPHFTEYRSTVIACLKKQDIELAQEIAREMLQKGMTLDAKIQELMKTTFIPHAQQ